MSELTKIKEEVKDEFDHVVEEIHEGIGPGGAYEPAVTKVKSLGKKGVIVSLVVLVAAIVLLVRACHGV
jgi:hypothetical protein